MLFIYKSYTEMHVQQNIKVSYSVGHLTSILQYDPRTPAATVVKRTAFTVTFTSQDSLFLGSNLEWTASLRCTAPHNGRLLTFPSRDKCVKEDNKHSSFENCLVECGTLF
jgi:hypothetical protein